jgi:flagellar protein FliO/FliZ
MRPAAQPEAPPAPPPEPPPPPAKEQQSDPFSVEEIEAEFARLLGRPLDRGDRPH